MSAVLRIGTAGWQIPKGFSEHFPSTGSHLERYANRFNAVEVNRTFYQLPRPSTVERWAATVPTHFRFALKMPKRITHEQQLRRVARPLKAFMEVAEAFGENLGPLLVQLPPKLEFTAAAEDFLEQLHEHAQPFIALEPRHASWFTSEVERLLTRLQVARVAANPSRGIGNGRPAGDGDLAYFRLHGTPRVYWSDYDAAELKAWARLARRSFVTAKEVWFVFDNTALGYATGNALDMQALLK